MSPLIEHGFVGKEIESFISDIRLEFSDLFQLCYEANKLSHKVLFETDAHSKHTQELLVITLYMKIMSSYQGVVILAERGMAPQAEVLLRAILEALFKLCAIVKHSKA